METPTYNLAIVRSFFAWSILWGIVAVLVGVLISFQLVEPALNLEPYLTYGRLRPLHTNAGIFGWGIGSFFALFLYMVQRLCRTPLWSDGLAKFQLYLFNATIIAAAKKKGFRTCAHIFYYADAKALSEKGLYACAHSVRDREVDVALIQTMKKNGTWQLGTLVRELSTFVFSKPAPFLNDPFFCCARHDRRR